MITTTMRRVDILQYSWAFAAMCELRLHTWQYERRQIVLLYSSDNIIQCYFFIRVT